MAPHCSRRVLWSAVVLTTLGMEVPEEIIPGPNERRKQTVLIDLKPLHPAVPQR